MFTAPFPALPTPRPGNRTSTPPRRWMSVIVLFAVLALHALSNHGTVLDHPVGGSTSQINGGAGDPRLAAAGDHQAERLTVNRLASPATGVTLRPPPTHPEHQCCQLATSRVIAAAHGPALHAVQRRQGPPAPTDLRSGCAAGPDVAGGVAPGARVLRV